MESSASSLRLSEIPAAGWHPPGGGPPGPGPLDGAGLELITPLVQEALHGGGEHLKIITVQIGVKGRRVELEEPLHQVVRFPGQGKRKTLGQVDLIDVTIPNVLPDAGEGRQKRLPGEIAHGGGPR